MCYIFIHSAGEIVEKFSYEFEDFDKLMELYFYAKKKYGSVDGFAFDVMIV